MMAFPVTVDPGLEEGLITVLPVKGRLLQTLERDGPRFMKKLRGVKGSRVGASARSSEEILGFRVNQINNKNSINSRTIARSNQFGSIFI